MDYPAGCSERPEEGKAEAEEPHGEVGRGEQWDQTGRWGKKGVIREQTTDGLNSLVRG